MLSWDDYNVEEQAPTTAPPPPPVAESSVLERAEEIVPAQVTVAVEPLAESIVKEAQDQPLAEPDSGRDDEDNANIARAKQAMESLDVAPGLEELEMGAGRVQVDDKAMINCHADLNRDR